MYISWSSRIKTLFLSVFLEALILSSLINLHQVSPSWSHKPEHIKTEDIKDISLCLLPLPRLETNL